MIEAKLKSIDEIAADLRERGELDEEKWRKFKEKNDFVIILRILIASFFLIVVVLRFSIVDIFIVIFSIIMLYFFEFLPNQKTKKELLNIFTYGIITHGVIEKYKEIYNRYGHLNFVMYMSPFGKADGKCKNRKKVYGSVEVDLDKTLKNKKKVKIIQLEYRPENFWIYTEKLNNLYNIRKKKSCPMLQHQ